MRILYLTTAMSEKYFDEYCMNARIKPNPSNQNFHLKLIKALSSKFNLEVISLRPFSSKMFNEYTLEETYRKEDELTFYYVKESSSLFDRLFYLEKDISSLVGDLIENDTIIVVDTLNEHLLKSALKIKKEYKNLVIGILSDNPENISHVSKRYIRAISSKICDMDGYITLTDELNILFNINKKPFYKLNGLIDDYFLFDKNENENYYFFGGALYERYGVLDMIDAFSKSSISANLIIAGHGDLDSTIKQIASKNPRIKYLGTISKKVMYGYEQHAIACINPRRYDEKLDKESIPSKVLEYAGNKALIISTFSKELENVFKESIIWVNEDTSLVNAINFANTLKVNQKIKYVNSVYEIATDKYSITHQGTKLFDFISSLKKS